MTAQRKILRQDGEISQVERFTKATATETGQSEGCVQREVERGKQLAEVTSRFRGVATIDPVSCSSHEATIDLIQRGATSALMQTRTLIFYRILGQQRTECGRIELTELERQELADKRLVEIAADDGWLTKFNDTQPADNRANAFSVGHITVYIGYS